MCVLCLSVREREEIQPQCSETHRAGGGYQFLHFSLRGVRTQRPQHLANLRDLEGMKYEIV